jgi:two-component system, response regulator, stage 0 sporulation protein A
MLYIYSLKKGGLLVRNIKIDTVIVDDNKEFCTVLSDCLSTQGDFAIEGICLNGIEAVKFVKETRPNLIVLDIVMPRLDGLGVLEKLIALNLKPKPIIVVLSAIGLDSITQRALSLGADYYFIKPFDMDEFITRVHQLIEKTGLESPGTRLGTAEDEKNMESQVTDILHELGIPANIKGHLYLRDAINLALSDISFLHSITTRLYPDLALKYKTIPSKIESSIRHAIEVGCSGGGSDTFKKLFARSSAADKYIPLNSEFIVSVTHAIKLKIL